MEKEEESPAEMSKEEKDHRRIVELARQRRMAATLKLVEEYDTDTG